MLKKDDYTALAMIRREIEGSNRINITGKGLHEQHEMERRRGQAISRAARMLGPGRIENEIKEWRR